MVQQAAVLHILQTLLLDWYLDKERLLELPKKP